MAMENKRIIQLSTERTTLGDDDYTIVDSDTNGTAKYRLSRLKETDTTLSVSGMAADAAATGQAISDEADAREAADDAIGEDIDDLKSAIDDVESSIESLEETKADVDGFYEDMTVGTAENVLSNKYALESVPYQFRKTGGDASVGSRLKEKIVGGTVAWNQLVQNGNFASTSNWSKVGAEFTVSNNAATITAGSTTDVEHYIEQYFTTIAGHIYCVLAESKTDGNDWIFRIYYNGISAMISKRYSDTTWLDIGFVINNTVSATNNRIRFITDTENSVANARNVMIIDLTAMFGTAIADYIYNLEQTTAGAGVALFRKLFPKEYYAFNAGELLSVSGLVSHDEIGFNQFDKSTAIPNSLINSSGNIERGSYVISDFIRVIPNTTYYIKDIETIVHTRSLVFYDANKNLVSVESVGSSATHRSFEKVIPSNVYYIRIGVNPDYVNKACVSLSDPSRNGEYESYVKHSYPLDSSLTLRGIPKLDANNNLYYDGDEYKSDGTVTRRYGVVDLGTLSWTKIATASSYYFLSEIIPTLKKQSDNYNVWQNLHISGAYDKVASILIATDSAGNMTYGGYDGGAVRMKNTTYSDPTSFKTAMSGVYLVYELATPTEESADPFVNPQICYKYGTEEYVSTSIVPVGHETEYFEDVVAKVDGLPWDLSMIAPIDNGTTATRAYTTGQYFLHNDQFCKAKTNIASGATFTLNTNYEVTTVAAELYTALH